MQFQIAFPIPVPGPAFSVCAAGRTCICDIIYDYALLICILNKFLFLLCISSVFQNFFLLTAIFLTGQLFHIRSFFFSILLRKKIRLLIVFCCQHNLVGQNLFRSPYRMYRFHHKNNCCQYD